VHSYAAPGGPADVEVPELAGPDGPSGRARTFWVSL